MVWKCVAVTFCQAVLNGGRTLAKVGLSARFELISSFALASQSSFISYKKRKTNKMTFVKSLCDIFKYDCKIPAECPWLKGSDKDYDDDLDGVYMEMAPGDQ